MHFLFSLTKFFRIETEMYTNIYLNENAKGIVLEEQFNSFSRRAKTFLRKNNIYFESASVEIDFATIQLQSCVGKV